MKHAHRNQDRMFVVALFTVAKNWKQAPVHLPEGEQPERGTLTGGKGSAMKRKRACVSWHD